MRSARGVFSLSINAPQTAMVLSASSAAAAAAQGAGSACGLVAGSAPGADTGDVPHKMALAASTATKVVRSIVRLSMTRREPPPGTTLDAFRIAIPFLAEI